MKDASTPEPVETASDAAATRRLPRNVVLLGLVSLFTDAASEMIFPLLPFFLVGVLHAPPALAGGIEGLADALASTLKLFAGRVADRLGRNQPLVVLGYALSTAARPLVALAGTPWHVLAVRLADRTGKGLRSSPRDAIIAASTPPERHGAAFGFHRAMDHAGAAIGPLIAFVVLTAWTQDLRALFALSIVPGVVAVLLLLAVREPTLPAPVTPGSPGGGLASWTLPAPPLRRYLLAVGATALGRPSEALLLPALGADRVPLQAVPLLWIGLHMVKVVFSLAGGRLADRRGRRTVVAAGWGVHVLVFVGLAAVESREAAMALFLAWGAAPGLSEGAEKALVGERAGAGGRATAFGWYHLVVGLATLPASAAFGACWQLRGAPLAYTVGAAAGVVGLACLAFAGDPPRPSAGATSRGGSSA